MDIIRIILSILLPPVGVFLQVGIGLQFWINILLTLLAFVHGSLILQEVFQSGPVDLAYPWLTLADLELDISFSLTLTNLVALELITGLSLLSQVYSLGYMDKEIVNVLALSTVCQRQEIYLFFQQA